MIENLTPQEKKQLYMKHWREANADKVKAYRKQWYANNPTYQQEWIEKNPEKKRHLTNKWRETNPDKLKASGKKWREANPEYHREYERKNKAKRNAQRQQRVKNNPNARIANVLRTRIRVAVKNGAKAGSAVRDLGCSIPEFREYIKSMFSEGMSWDNHGEWHLDHIKPLASFDLTDRHQFLEATHFSNYQPLWKLENLKKGAKALDNENESV